jgi:hypothetical protein
MSDDIARLEGAIKDLTVCVNNLTTLQKVMFNDAEYLKKAQADIQAHIEYSKPILAKSATWQANVNTWFVRIVATVLASSIALFSYNSSQPSQVNMKLSKVDVQHEQSQIYGKYKNPCDPRLETCPRPKRIAMRDA